MWGKAIEVITGRAREKTYKENDVGLDYT